MQVAAENYPFCTIDPSVSRVEVQDERFDWLCEHFKPASKVPSFLQVTDIAGLVKGAAEGAGLGNAFLSHIQAVDCIFHVLRAFDDAEVTHVEDTIDPVRDLEIIAGELLRKDREWVRSRKKLAEQKMKNVKAGQGIEQKEVDMLTKIEAHLESGKAIRKGTWTMGEVELLNTMQLLTAKQNVILVNMCEEDYKRKKNKWLPKIKAWLDEHADKDVLIPMSCVVEDKLASMDAAERKTYEEETKMISACPKVVKAGLKALNMQCYFTAGSDEVRSWGIQVGTKAPGAAGVIHSDFEKGFIMAETMGFDDLKRAESVAALKAGGKYKMNGKEYVVQDGDIINFKFNTPQKENKKDKQKGPH